MRLTSTLLRYLTSAFFLGMSALQANDPDPAYWVLVYVFTAVIPHSKWLGRVAQPTFWLAAGLILAGLLQSFPGFLEFVQLGDVALLTAPMTEKIPAIEHAREFLGLLFSVLCLALYGSPHQTTRDSKPNAYKRGDTDHR